MPESTDPHDSQIVLIIPERLGWPKVYAGKWRWEPALELIEFVHKGQHRSASRYVHLLDKNQNTPRQALLKALRMEMRRIQEIALPTD